VYGFAESVYGDSQCRGYFTYAPALLSREQKSKSDEDVKVAESDLHRTMKSIVREDLEVDDYTVVEEPLFPPADWLHWESYRPDLLGLKSDGRSEQLVIAECETHPNMKRFLAKNYGSLWFQPSVYCDGSIRRILAIPRGRLAALDMQLRQNWEIWIIDVAAHVLKIASIGREEDH
jgi:hypothetical protein